MVAQRGVAVNAAEVKLLKTPETVGKAAAARPAALAPKRKFSFKEKHALETLPKRMDELHETKRMLGEKLADTTFFARDPAGFQKASFALAKADADLTRAEEEWLALEMLREEIGGWQSAPDS